MMNSEIPENVRDKINSLKEQYYSKGSIVREITKLVDSKEQAKLYVEQVTNENKQLDADNPMRVNNRSKSDIKTGFTMLPLGVIAFFLIPALGIGMVLGGFVFIIFGIYHRYRYKKLAK